MKLQSSYIFLKNPYKEIQKSGRASDGTFVHVAEKRVYSYIKESFSAISMVDDYGSIYKKKYICSIQNGNVTCNIEFIITEVVGISYLDISVEGNSKAQIIMCLENIQYTLFNSGIRENYIDIISYDSISEYYCNRIFAKLNALERNLRKLLFNIYILNFGKDYFQATMNIELQGLINSNSSKEKRTEIKKAYNVSSAEAKIIDSLQQFFYSFEFSDMQKLLFNPSWTSVDKESKEKFLSEHKDLSRLTNDELREAFSHFSPKSDWERFFSSKIDIVDIEAIIDKIRLYRNAVAHFKLFCKRDYEVCNKLINRLNTAIINAIQLTEKIDFAEKNFEVLKNALSNLAEKLGEIFAPIAEVSQKLFESEALKRLGEIFRQMQESVSAVEITVTQFSALVTNNSLVTNDSLEKVDIVNSEILVDS